MRFPAKGAMTELITQWYIFLNQLSQGMVALTEVKTWQRTK